MADAWLLLNSAQIAPRSLQFEASTPTSHKTSGSQEEIGLSDIDKVDHEFVVKRMLFQYQQHAVKWLEQTDRKWGGALLCDDMGLGKTPTVLAYTISLEAPGPYFPVLILAPTGMVVRNIEDEINLTIYGDPKIMSYTSLREIWTADCKQWPHMHYVIMTVVLWHYVCVDSYYLFYILPA